MQSKAFERSVNIAPLILPLSIHFRHFSVITRTQCCVLILRVYDWSIYTLIVEARFIYLQQIREDAYWTIVSNIVLFFVFKNRNYIYIFNSEGKVASNIELLKLWKTNSEKISMLSFIIFTDIKLSWQAFMLSRSWISAKSYFLFQK